jgi:Mn-dependent DtxR family transcriptional regulator
MTLADERILEYLSELGNNQTSQIAKEFGFHRKYIGKRCRILEKHGFVDNRGNGVYQITELGEKYLSGEFDASTLDDDGSGSERPASA